MDLALNAFGRDIPGFIGEPLDEVAVVHHGQHGPGELANACSKRLREGISRWLIGSSSSRRLQPWATSRPASGAPARRKTQLPATGAEDLIAAEQEIVQEGARFGLGQRRRLRMVSSASADWVESLLLLGHVAQAHIRPQAHAPRQRRQLPGRWCAAAWSCPPRSAR